MMRKDKGFRGPRRRGFDDDMPTPNEIRPARPARSFSDPPRDAAPPQGPVVDATVKWFNSEKGFGFAELSDGSGDVFMHVGALQASGFDSVQPGAKLRVQVGHGAKGPQITRVVEVDETTVTPQPARGSGGGGRGAPGGGAGGPPRGGRQTNMASAVDMEGTVKWFNGDKGFGFVASDDGGKDVFVHVSVLGEAGLVHLAEGQQVLMRVVDTPKGREAVSISLSR